MSEEAKEKLKLRLASGEIGAAEYLQLLSIIVDQDKNLTQNNPTHSATILAEHKGHTLYNDKIVSSDGTFYLINQIDSISTTNFKQTINFIPIWKFTGFTCYFLDGKSFSLIETKTLFAGASHNSIANFCMKISKLSFKSRMEIIFQKIKAKGRYLVRGSQDSCSITIDGKIEQGKKKIDLKEARKSGFLCIGSKEISGITGVTNSSHRYDPNEIIVSSYSSNNGRIPKDAIRCSPSANSDVIIGFINWFSTDGNYL
jgi:hypothetical protein